MKDVITGGATTFTVVELDFVGSATDVAVIVYTPAVDGAVQVAPDHEPAPPELQVTAALTAFCADAVKACVALVVTYPAAGDGTVTATVCGVITPDVAVAV